MKKINIDGLLALNLEEIEIVYRRCREETVENIAKSKGIPATTIWNVRLPKIRRILGVDGWREIEEELCIPLRSIISSEQALREGWPEAFREKIEALREPPLVTNPSSTTSPSPIEPQIQPQSSTTVTQQNTQGNQDTIRPPWIIIGLFLLILCLLGFWAVPTVWQNFLTMFGNLSTPTQAMQTPAAQVPTSTISLQLINTAPVASQTSLPSPTNTVVPSTSISPTPTLTPVPPSPTLASGSIPFAGPDDPATLNPVFGWQPGKSEASSYVVNPATGVLTIISGSDTDQWQGENSVPLIIYPIEGNFEVQVKTTIDAEKNFQLAGLGIKAVGDNTTWVRVDRGFAYGQNAGFLATHKGRTSATGGVPYSDDTIYVRIEKNGSLVTLSHSADGVHWVTLKKDFVVEMSNEVEIYLFVLSNTNIGTVAHFSDFQVFRR